MISLLKRLNGFINWDAIGISTSLACAIHCALLPLFLTSLPVFGVEIIHNNIVEYGMIFLAGLIGTAALFHGYKKHHHKVLPLVVFVAGFCFLLAKEIFTTWEHFLLFPAAASIISAHYINYRFCRKAGHCHSSDCSHEHLL